VHRYTGRAVRIVHQFARDAAIRRDIVDYAATLARPFSQNVCADRLERPEKYDWLVIRAEYVDVFGLVRLDANDVIVHVSKYADAILVSRTRTAERHAANGTIESRRLVVEGARHKKTRLDNVARIRDSRDQIHISKKYLARIENEVRRMPGR